MSLSSKSSAINEPTLITMSFVSSPGWIGIPATSQHSRRVYYCMSLITSSTSLIDFESLNTSALRNLFSLSTS